MTPELAVGAAILICLVAAGGAALARRGPFPGALALVATAASAALALGAAAAAFGGHASPAPVAPWPGGPRFHVDGLSAIFLALAAVLAVPAELYALGYLPRRHPEPAPGSRGGFHALLLAFLAAMYGLVSTTDMMWFFLVFWQLMTIPGWALIRWEGRPEGRRAARRYLWMMQLACAATLVGAELLVAAAGPAPGPRYDLETVRAALPGLLRARPALCAAAFGLFLAGFGVKMGMWPAGQVWLPDAHPAAPAPVSALLSGVMIKTGVYGLVRYFLWLPPEGSRRAFPLAAWGAAVAALGTVTLLTGTAQALAQDRSKRLLACHSIGQIGYVLLGVGACLALLAAGTPAADALASLALVGALLHVVNHGLFKSLLFLDAGSMQCATGTLELDRMGGLGRHMPVTGATALVGALAISGVPLLNGFVSKWMICAAALLGGHQVRYLPLCGVLALLTSGLTLASFVKFLAAGFLGRASAGVRARAARGPLEVGRGMLAAQLLLAAACLVLGLAPALALGPLARALADGRGLASALAGAAPVEAAAWGGLTLLGGAARYAPLAALALLGAGLLAAAGLGRLGGSVRRSAEPWLCGYVRPADAYRVPAHGLFGPLRPWLRWAGGAPPPEAPRAAAEAGPPAGEEG